MGGESGGIDWAQDILCAADGSDTPRAQRIEAGKIWPPSYPSRRSATWSQLKCTQEFFAHWVLLFQNTHCRELISAHRHCIVTHNITTFFGNVVSRAFPALFLKPGDFLCGQFHTERIRALLIQRIERFFHVGIQMFNDYFAASGR
ncbi:hypothetical protein I7I50_06306 [Histoplasma capsulatum G186AR]|uniref:Uncharacterized protein n=1 Tax=Ajellomyces capsulatus TaxID=5037 RepID=A0A8H7Z2T2_AJECA|nr:hypothetical protein I7I52_10621 [Histoplasma capsulatum]QSS67282.1 hypothetical protein I7I50_06306 [Histoplasma capsulatum G186AR]